MRFAVEVRVAADARREAESALAAESLVEEEGLTWDQLRTMNVEQLKLVKIPMGKALSMKKHGFRP